MTAEPSATYTTDDGPTEEEMAELVAQLDRLVEGVYPHVSDGARERTLVAVRHFNDMASALGPQRHAAVRGQRSGAPSRFRVPLGRALALLGAREVASSAESGRYRCLSGDLTAYAASRRPTNSSAGAILRRAACRGVCGNGFAASAHCGMFWAEAIG
jgi:hypothetical protein